LAKSTEVGISLRKYLAIFVVILAVAQKPLPVYGYDQHQQTQQKSGEARPDAQAAVAADVGKENAANAQRFAYYKANPKEYFKAAFAPANISNWVLAVLGIVGGLLGWWTILGVKRQSKHIVSSERAWMVPAISSPSFGDVMNPADKADNWLLPIEVSVTNRGKTPAIVINKMITSVSAPTRDRYAIPLEPVQTEKPPYKEPLGFRERKSAIGSLYATGDLTYLGAALSKKKLMEENAAWRSGERCLCLMGYVEYRDAFGKYRITRFCYAYQSIVEGGSLVNAITKEPVFPPEFRKVDMPKIYNEAT